MHTKMDEKWCEIFEYLIDQNIDLNNIYQELLDILWPMAGTNATVDKKTFLNVII